MNETSRMPDFRRRLLVVDDEPDARGLVAEFALEGGYDVVQAANATEALVAVAAGSIDAVITDVVMPGMDGIELARRIKARYPGVPVLVMTGHPDTLDAIIDSGSLPLPTPVSLER